MASTGPRINAQILVEFETASTETDEVWSGMVSLLDKSQREEKSFTMTSGYTLEESSALNELGRVGVE